MRIAVTRVEHPDAPTTAFSHENLNDDQIDEVNLYQAGDLKNNPVQKAFTKEGSED
mgnify:CR=1 FL=1